MYLGSGAGDTTWHAVRTRRNRVAPWISLSQFPDVWDDHQLEQGDSFNGR